MKVGTRAQPSFSHVKAAFRHVCQTKFKADFLIIANTKMQIKHVSIQQFGANKIDCMVSTEGRTVVYVWHAVINTAFPPQLGMSLL